MNIKILKLAILLLIPFLGFSQTFHEVKDSKFRSLAYHKLS